MGKNWNHHAKRGGNRGNSHFRPPKDHIQLCFCISYSGFAFRGLQLQAHEPTHHTVEGTFVCALLDAGVILDVQQGHIHDAHNFFSRSCRTDRGVHAMRNVVSLFIPKRRWDETFQSSTAIVQERVQSALQRRLQMYPPEKEDETQEGQQNGGNNNNKRTTMMMTIHTVTQVMSSFSPKNNCTRRVYHYWLPLYALQGGADGWEGLFRAFPDLREACNFLKEEIEATRGGTTSDEHFVDLDATDSESPSPSDTTVPNWTTAWRQQLAKANSDVLRKFVGTHRFHNYTADPADVRGGGSVNGKAISPLDDEALRTISRCAIQPRVYFVPVRGGGGAEQQTVEGNPNNTDHAAAVGDHAVLGENHSCAVEGSEGSPTLDSVVRCVSMIRRLESNQQQQVEQRTLSDRLAGLCGGVVPAVTEDVAQQLCGCAEGGRFLPGAVPVKFADAARSLPSHLPFVLFQVEGNSFLLNMIRKLVGMLLAVLRGARPTLVEDSLLPSSRIAVPMAPGGYLMLSCSMYHSYDAQVRANREAANARRRLRDEQQRIGATTNATTEQGKQKEGDEVAVQRSTDVPVPPPHTGPAYQPLDEAWDEADVSAQARSFLFHSLLSDVVRYDLNLMPPLDTLFYLRDAAFASLALPIATASCATTATAATKEGPGRISVPSLDARLDAHLVEMKEFSPSRPPLSGHPNASEMTIFLRMLRVHLWNIRPVVVPPESKAGREMAKRAAAAAVTTAADTAAAEKEEGVEKTASDGSTAIVAVPRTSALPVPEPLHQDETEGDSVAAAVSLLSSSSRKRRREEEQGDVKQDGEGDDGDDAAVIPPCFDDGWWYHCPTRAEEAVPRRAVFLARYRSSMAYTVALRNQNKTRQLLQGLTTTTNEEGGEEEEDVDVMSELPPCGGDE